MKNIVRFFVLALVVTGAAASTQITPASAQTKVASPRPVLCPIPTCAPDDPNACGMYGSRGNK